ncbi:Macrolide export protein MacA [Pseudobythopirellula maris]|uniref:Macrolide export protein MacA n=2 Tax=Pseudobythopirellula maris TaxID=2527991 RepID=A0A5C5ZRC1_9BACT|nr:Macrolide export protein MacA [Pseudobythopirellula maris]
MSSRVQALRLDAAEMPSSAGSAVPRYVAMGVVAALLIGGWVSGTTATIWKSWFGPFPVPSHTAMLYDPVDAELSLTGYTEASQTAEVAPRIAGTIVSLPIEEGDRVEVGQVIAVLDREEFAPDLLQAQASVSMAKAQRDELVLGSREEEVAQAEANLAKAESALHNARRAFERADSISDVISPAELDKAESAFKSAEATVEQLTHAVGLLKKGPRAERIAAADAEVQRAEAVLAKAEYVVNATDITSPLTGTVIERRATLGARVVPGPMVGPGSSLILCTIADLSKIEAVVDIPESQAGDVQIGQPCLITTEAHTGREFHGEVAWLSPVYNRQRGVRAARVTVDNEEGLVLPDMTCRVRVLGAAAPEDTAPKLLVPASLVVVGQEGGERVLIEADGRAAWADIKTEPFDGDRKGLPPAMDGVDFVEVTSGLEEGAVVLDAANSRIRPGQPVEPVPVSL